MARRKKLKVGEPNEESVTLVAQLDDFTRAYLVAALWSTTDNADDSGGAPLDTNYTLEHCTPGLLKDVIKDCADFQQQCAALLRDGFIEERNARRSSYSIDDRAGHDFWLTRNGHGAGFWDGDWVEPVGQMLTDAAKSFGEVDLYVTDDGLIA